MGTNLRFDMDLRPYREIGEFEVQVLPDTALLTVAEIQEALKIFCCENCPDFGLKK